MELYNKEFVYFDWDDKLEGKKGFFSDNISDLKRYVKDNRTKWYGVICKYSRSDNVDVPFEIIDDSGWHCNFRFCYYDPYYEFRKAYLEGKQLQFKSHNDWKDVECEPIFNGDEYRIKPELRWHVVLSDEGTLAIAKSTNKSIYFTGDDEECKKWIDEHKNLTDIMKAWEEGKTIQYFYNDDWRDVANNNPLWGIDNTYRIKPDECKEYAPFESVHELINAWEKKSGVKFNHELAMPFIWIKNKEKNRVYLITDFLFERCYGCDVGTEDDNLKLKELFDDFTFLDGSIIGKVKE